MISPRIIAIYAATATVIVVWFNVAPRLVQPAAHVATPVTVAPEPRPVPDFTLTDQHGQAVSKTDLAGRVWLANFIFSSCPGPCLDLTKRMRSIQEALADRPEVDLVSFSIDPANDTPAKLAEYAQQVGAGPKWHFLTGERAITARVANDGFLFALSPDASNFDHSDRIALVDAQGMVRGWFDSYSPKLVEEVRSLMRSL